MVNPKKAVKFARKLAEKGEIMDAFKILFELTEKKPDFKEGWIILGDLYYSVAYNPKKGGMDSNRLSKALRAYLKALDLDPNAPPLWDKVGDICKEMGAAEKAINAYEKAISFGITNKAEVYMKLGNISASRNEWERASEYYAVALKENPEDARAIFKLGEMKYRTGRFEEAKKLLEDALNRSDGKDYAPRLLLGIIYLEEGNYDKSTDFLKEALLLRPKLAVIWEKLGDAYLGNGDKINALFCYTIGGELGDISAKEKVRALSEEDLRGEADPFLKKIVDEKILAK